MVCSKILQKSTNLRYFNSPQTLEEFRKSRTWNHEDQKISVSAIKFYTQNVDPKQAADDLITNFKAIESGQESMQVLSDLLNKLKGSSLNVKEKQKILIEASEKIKETDNYRTAIDIHAFVENYPKKFYPSSDVVIKNLEDIEQRIDWFVREQDFLDFLFENLVQVSGPEIKTNLLVDKRTLAFKPQLEEVSLLKILMRRGRLDLFTFLALSPEIKGKLRLEYGVDLMYEVQDTISTDLGSQALYRSLVYGTFSEEARKQYDVGKRGVKTTLWDYIPLDRY